MGDDATADTGKNDVTPDDQEGGLADRRAKMLEDDDVELQAPDYAQEESAGGDPMNKGSHDEVWRSGLERKGREAEEEGPMGPLEETFPVRP